MRLQAHGMRHARQAVAVLGVAALLMAGCGDDDDDETSTGDEDTTGTTAGGPELDPYREDGLTIGIANERPYGFEEGGEATGEAPELGRAIFSRLGIDDVNYVVTEFGSLINGLNAGRMDTIAAGMFINPDRAEQVLFTDPDYCATTAFAVPEGNPEDLSDFQSIIDAEVTLGVLGGAVEEGYALDIGVPEGQIESFQNPADLFDGLEAGRADAVALTAPTIRTQTAEMDGFEATDGFIPVVNGEEQLGCGAFAFRYEDQVLRDAFNEQLHAMQENDEILPIIEEFGFTEDETGRAEELTANDLAGGAYDDLESGGSDTTAAEGGETTTTAAEGGG